MIKQKMKNKIYSFIKSIFWPLLIGIGQFLITWIVSFYYICKENITLEEISEPQFQIQFEKFLENQGWFLILGNLLLLFLIFSVFKRKREKEENKNMVLLTESILLGSCFGILLNLIFSKIFVNPYKEVSIKMFFLELCTIGMIGPMIEELTYRGIMYQILKQAFSMKTVAIVVTLLFAFSHQGLQNILYALLMGSLFYLLLQKGTIGCAIAAHISANTSTLLLGFLTKGWNHYLFLPFGIIVIEILIYSWLQKKKKV